MCIGRYNRYNQQILPRLKGLDLDMEAAADFHFQECENFDAPWEGMRKLGKMSPSLQVLARNPVIIRYWLDRSK